MKYVCLLFVLFVPGVLAQSLPPHEPLNVVVVSDEVNPHNLNDEDLMQPGDLSAVLAATSVLNVNHIVEIETDQIEQATAELNRASNDPLKPDVLIYFSHRIPNSGGNEQVRQDTFVAATEAFLEQGGGVIAFHHGLYQTNGKQGIQQLFGSQATGSVPWNTVNGQDVIFTGGDHFIGTHNISYQMVTSYENEAHGIQLNNYPFFNNTPDERYPNMGFNSGADDCSIVNLFESNYNQGGNQHLLAYTKQCSGWLSQVFAYQPGEYQPNATSGINYQILLNAIYYLTDFHWDVIHKAGFE